MGIVIGQCFNDFQYDSGKGWWICLITVIAKKVTLYFQKKGYGYWCKGYGLGVKGFGFPLNI